MYIKYFTSKELTDEEIDFAFNTGLIGKLVMYKPGVDSELNRIKALKKEISKIIVQKALDREYRLREIVEMKKLNNQIIEKLRFSM